MNIQVNSQIQSLPVQQAKPAAPQTKAPAGIKADALGSDKISLKGAAAGAIGGAAAIYAPLVVAGYGLGSPFGASFKQALAAPLMESWTRSTIGVGAVVGGLAGAYASKHADSKAEGLKSGAIIGAVTGAIAGAASSLILNRDPMWLGTAIGGALVGGIAGSMAGGAGGYTAKALGN